MDMRISAREVERAVALRRQGASVNDIARILHRSRAALTAALKRAMGEAFAPDWEPRRPWTTQEVLTAAAMRRAGKLHAEIAAAINRTVPAVVMMLTRARHERRPEFHFLHPPRDPEEEAAHAEWRRIAEVEPRDLAAALFGDPLPGRSALDKYRPPAAVRHRPWSEALQKSAKVRGRRRPSEASP